MSSAKKITLKSSDGEAFEVDEAVLMESETTKHMIEDGSADSGIPVPNVTSEILAKLIEYCKKHVKAANPEDQPSKYELKAWDADFIKVDPGTLLNLVVAADYLKINSLLDLTCETVADLMKGKTREEILTYFNIVGKTF